jgi:hypothetical protein
VTQQQLPESDPRHHTRKIKAKLDELVTHLREDISKIDDAKAKVMFEVSAEVLSGLSKAYGDYEARNEAAFR